MSKSKYCMHKYKQDNRSCPNVPVKGSILCRKHRYTMKKNPHQYNILKNNGKINKSIPFSEKTVVDDDASSILTIQEDEEDIQSTVTQAGTPKRVRDDDHDLHHNDDYVDISRNFIFKCIDEYFEEHQKRQDYLKSFKKGDDKKGGMDMNMLLSIGGMSLLPMLGKFIQNNMPNTNINNGSNIKEDFIRDERPERQQPKQDHNFINADNNKTTEWTKV